MNEGLLNQTPKFFTQRVIYVNELADQLLEIDPENVTLILVGGFPCGWINSRSILKNGGPNLKDQKRSLEEQHQSDCGEDHKLSFTTIVVDENLKTKWFDLAGKAINIINRETGFYW